MACLAFQQFLYLGNQLPALKCSVLNAQECSVYWLDSVSGRSGRKQMVHSTGELKRVE